MTKLWFWECEVPTIFFQKELKKDCQFECTAWVTKLFDSVWLYTWNRQKKLYLHINRKGSHIFSHFNVYHPSASGFCQPRWVSLERASCKIWQKLMDLQTGSTTHLSPIEPFPHKVSLNRTYWPLFVGHLKEQTNKQTNMISFKKIYLYFHDSIPNISQGEQVNRDRPSCHQFHQKLE